MHTFLPKSFKRTLIATGISVLSLSAYGQKQDTETKNIVKLNVPALLLKNVSLQYERAIGERTSVALGVRFAPKSSLPFKGKIKDLLDDEQNARQVDNLTIGNFAITPEFRYYFGEEGVFHGFYVAPFARYATYSARVNPYEYTVEDTPAGPQTRMIDLKGNISTFTGGLMVGAQWKLSRQFYFDWWIIGASAGTSSGTIKGISPTKLDETEQKELREDLEELNDIDVIKTKTTVDENGATVKVDGPWYTLRAGLSVGFRF